MLLRAGVAGKLGMAGTPYGFSGLTIRTSENLFCSKAWTNGDTLRIPCSHIIQ
jgi:hypothetical protein